ncbi:MAG: hypothetical protein HC806_00375 [Anaerolineae bacterium]|nr:hypothetical protein [Anaerolineae bacterium]
MNKIFLATFNNGISRAECIAGEWVVTRSLEGFQTNCLATDLHHPQQVYAGTQTGGYSSSQDGAKPGSREVSRASRSKPSRLAPIPQTPSSPDANPFPSTSRTTQAKLGKNFQPFAPENNGGGSPLPSHLIGVPTCRR